MNEKIEQIPNNEPLKDLSDSIDTQLESNEQKADKKYIEDKDAFLNHLKDVGYEDVSIELIDEAYDLSYRIFWPIKRETGEPYFDHLMGVSLILINECRINDPEMVIAALFHDAIEDSVVYGDTSMPISVWRKIAYTRLSKTFNSNVAKMVITLTRPRVNGVEIKNDKEARDVYISKLQETEDLRIILIKMADRLHNLRTLPGTTPEKQRHIVKETEEIYFTIFERALDQYPEEANYLLDEMRLAISVLTLDEEV